MDTKQTNIDEFVEKAANRVVEVLKKKNDEQAGMIGRALQKRPGVTLTALGTGSALAGVGIAKAIGYAANKVRGPKDVDDMRAALSMSGNFRLPFMKR